MLRLTILLLCTIAPFIVAKPAVVSPCLNRPICDIFCPYGNQLDTDGCPKCACNTSPCDNGQVPLAGYFCGRGSTHQDCPSNSTCKIAPNDAYAVCCPKCSKSTVKPGNCPKQTGIGSCLASCSNDSNCMGKQKCCGNCPRKCTDPI